MAMATQETKQRRYETLAVAARRVSLHPKTLRRWNESGLLPIYQPAGAGGRVLVRSDELDALIENGAR